MSSNRVDDNEELKTSEQWYHEHWSEQDIVDPDGWRYEEEPMTFWYTRAITFADFRRRALMSTGVPYDSMQHQSPFTCIPCSVCVSRRDCIVPATTLVGNGKDTTYVCEKHAPSSRQLCSLS